MQVFRLIPSVEKLLRAFKCAALLGAVLFPAQSVAEPVPGVIAAEQSADLSVDFPGRVSKIYKRSGEAFKAGETLLSFDCRAQEAQLLGARANLKVRKLEYDNQRELSRMRAAGKLDVAVALAEQEGAAAQVAELEARISLCSIIAPYDGQIAQLDINQFENAVVNQPFMRIINRSSLELRLIVPSQWLSWLRSGSKFQFTLDETGLVLDAEVLRIGAEVDAVSHTVSVLGRLSGSLAERHPGELVLPGMSGVAKFAGAQ